MTEIFEGHEVTEDNSLQWLFDLYDREDAPTVRPLTAEDRREVERLTARESQGGRVMMVKGARVYR